MLQSVLNLALFFFINMLGGKIAKTLQFSSIINLLGLLNLMLGKLDPTEEAIMDKALWQTYAKKDITEQSDFHSVQVPVMQDLVEVLSGMVGAESLTQRLTKFTEGTFAGIFNQSTNIALNNQLMVFSIRDLEECFREPHWKDSSLSSEGLVEHTRRFLFKSIFASAYPVLPATHASESIRDRRVASDAYVRCERRQRVQYKPDR